MECVRPIMDNDKSFRKLIKKRGFSWRDSNNVHCLAKCLNLFENHAEFENLTRSLNQMIIKHLKPNYIRDYLEKFFTYNKNYKPNKPLLELFKYQIDWLNNEIKKPIPVFSWSMPDAVIPEHKEFEEFLKSDRTDLVLRFDTKLEAIKFAIKNRGHRTNYSAKLIAEGKDGDASVKVKKTRDWYESKLKRIKSFKEELDEYKKYNLNI